MGTTHPPDRTDISTAWPDTVAGRIKRPLGRFLHMEAASGVLLLACTTVALLAANTSWAGSYSTFWNQTFRLGVASFELSYPLWYWVNDGLMAVFFFVVGLEIKRELVAGELADRRRVALPMAAAAGGALLPALIYFALQHGSPHRGGWAVPMATDIAFVVGGLALLGSRVPRGLKIFLLSLAIVDDLLAVIVIAAFYTETIHIVWLAAAGGGLAVVVLMNRTGVRTIPAYVLVGAMIWLCTLKSGVHPTVAGALLGLLTPVKAWIDKQTLQRVVEDACAHLDRVPDEHDSTREHGLAEELALTARESISPLERLEVDLHPWVAFAIMPVFALANAGVPVSAGAATDAVSLSVASGLVLGKPAGIVLTALLVVRLGWGRLPQGVSWAAMVGAGLLGGIGFTMSMFIASLALSESALVAAKTGILLGSAASGLLGMTVLALSLRRPSP